jgi:hypothetical protein
MVIETAAGSVNTNALLIGREYSAVVSSSKTTNAVLIFRK